MKIAYLLLPALLLADPAAALAQTAPAATAASAASRYDYCTLVCSGRSVGFVQVMAADGRGLQALGSPEPNKTQVKQGLHKFASNMDAVRYLTDQGWELMQESVFPADPSFSFAEVHYLLRRPKAQ
jgi:hypothetical protein